MSLDEVLPQKLACLYVNLLKLDNCPKRFNVCQLHKESGQISLGYDITLHKINYYTMGCGQSYKHILQQKLKKENKYINMIQLIKIVIMKENKY